MRKLGFLFVCLLWINNVYALTEKAYIVFAAELNEIQDKEKGSYSELASLLADYRHSKTPTFFIFGGDSLFPSILSSFDSGSHIIDLLNSLDPDVMAANKGDFGFTEDELSLRSYEAAFPIVQSNITEIATQKNLDGVLDSAILTQGDYKIGFISIMDQIDVDSYNLTRIKLKNPRTVITNKAQELRHQGVDFIILHYAGNELNCVDFLNEGLVDIVLRKRTSMVPEDESVLVKYPRQIFLSAVEQAVVIELNWQTGAPQTLVLKTHNKALSSYPKDVNVEQQIQGYVMQLKVLLDQVVGITTTALDLSRGNLRIKENAFGNLITDLMKQHSGADIAILNSGAIRGEAHYAQNTRLQRRDVIKALPYRNTVVLVNISGAQLWATLENGFSKIKEMSGRFPQVSGMNIVYNSQAEPGQRIISVNINNHPIDLAKHYKLAITVFLSQGGDGYNMFKALEPIVYNQQMSELMSDILMTKLRTVTSISPTIDGRIIDIAVQE